MNTAPGSSARQPTWPFNRNLAVHQKNSSDPHMVATALAADRAGPWPIAVKSATASRNPTRTASQTSCRHTERSPA